MLERFLPRTEFDSYEDFKKNYRLSCPPDFNFATHVVDAWAAEDPGKRASGATTTAIASALPLGRSPCFPAGPPPTCWPRGSERGTG